MGKLVIYDRQNPTVEPSGLDPAVENSVWVYRQHDGILVFLGVRHGKGDLYIFRDLLTQVVYSMPVLDVSINDWTLITSEMEILAHASKNKNKHPVLGDLSVGVEAQPPC